MCVSLSYVYIIVGLLYYSWIDYWYRNSMNIAGRAMTETALRHLPLRLPLFAGDSNPNFYIMVWQRHCAVLRAKKITIYAWNFSMTLVIVNLFGKVVNLREVVSSKIYGAQLLDNKWIIHLHSLLQITFLYIFISWPPGRYMCIVITHKILESPKCPRLI